MHSVIILRRRHCLVCVHGIPAHTCLGARAAGCVTHVQLTAMDLNSTDCSYLAFRINFNGQYLQPLPYIIVSCFVSSVQPLFYLLLLRLE